MKKKISPYLKDMIVNMVLVQKFVGNISFAELVANKEKYLAVQRCIELIGEAGDRVLKQSPDIEKKYPEIRWDQIIGMRVVMAHHYDKINDQKVWDTIKKSIPETKPQIEKLYADVLKEESFEKEKSLKQEKVQKKELNSGHGLEL